MSPSSSPRPEEDMTAAQRVFGIAELLDHIASFMLVDQSNTDESNTTNLRHQDLASFARVNKFCFAKLVSKLWFRVPGWLERVFEAIEPKRREFYANNVAEGSVRLWADSQKTRELFATSGALEVLSFPKLTRLHIFMCRCVDGEVSLPAVDCPNVRVMIIYPPFKHAAGVFSKPYPDAEVWESIFWDISTKYPSLKELKAICPPYVFPNAIRRLQKRHPNLRGSLDQFEHREIECKYDKHG
ncbi:uncharacterized protein N7515_009751 [Penicillium bovifimosum]|uniref:Uncharacterized protein n=1 Tax=Penicillium bovifimosum TaxID=126998 RepID=A0A9W9GH27_9EURO|nr:uncharacterized protein N7515_009751 [Penicillium bovifimosum]KAJ5120363.1 hypothetical protein N7515_009751 [Penicillium bovifimosum]